MRNVSENADQQRSYTTGLMRRLPNKYSKPRAISLPTDNETMRQFNGQNGGPGKFVIGSHVHWASRIVAGQGNHACTFCLVSPLLYTA